MALERNNIAISDIVVNYATGALVLLVIFSKMAPLYILSAGLYEVEENSSTKH